MLTNVVFYSNHLPLASKKVFARQTTRDDVIAFFKTMREALLFRWPRPNPAINRINNRTKRVNAWLNDETRQEVPLRIEPEAVSPKVVQKIKYRDCGAAKVPDSAPINADRKTGASLPSQTYVRAK